MATSTTVGNKSADLAAEAQQARAIKVDVESAGAASPRAGGDGKAMNKEELDQPKTRMGRMKQKFCGTKRRALISTLGCLGCCGCLVLVYFIIYWIYAYYNGPCARFLHHIIFGGEWSAPDEAEYEVKTNSKGVYEFETTDETGTTAFSELFCTEDLRPGFSDEKHLCNVYIDFPDHCKDKQCHAVAFFHGMGGCAKTWYYSDELQKQIYDKDNSVIGVYLQGVRADNGEDPAWHIGGSGIMSQDYDDEDDVTGGKDVSCHANPLASSSEKDCDKLPRDMLWVREVMRIIQRSNMNYANKKYEIDYKTSEPLLGAAQYMMDSFRNVMRFFIVGHSNGSQLVNKIAANAEMFPNLIMASGSATQTTKKPLVSDHSPMVYNVPASVQPCRTGSDCLQGAACDAAIRCDLCAVDSTFCPAIGSGVSCAGVATTPPKSHLDKTYFYELMRQKHNCARSDVEMQRGLKVRHAHFHNKEDKVVKYEGGDENPAHEQDLYSFEDALILWSNENAGCSGNLGNANDTGLITSATTRNEKTVEFGEDGSWFSSDMIEGKKMSYTLYDATDASWSHCATQYSMGAIESFAELFPVEYYNTGLEDHEFPEEADGKPFFEFLIKDLYKDLNKKIDARLDAQEAQQAASNTQTTTAAPVPTTLAAVFAATIDSTLTPAQLLVDTNFTTAVCNAVQASVTGSTGCTVTSVQAQSTPSSLLRRLVEQQLDINYELQFADQQLASTAQQSVAVGQTSFNTALETALTQELASVPTASLTPNTVATAGGSVAATPATTTTTTAAPTNATMDSNSNSTIASSNMTDTSSNNSTANVTVDANATLTNGTDSNTTASNSTDSSNSTTTSTTSTTSTSTTTSTASTTTTTPTTTTTTSTTTTTTTAAPGA